MPMAGEVVKRIFEYDNYRFFLRDFFKEQKRLKAAFSHRFFARRAGFSSSSFCAHVIEGKRNLTADSLRRMLKGLGLSGRPATYFESLVHYNQARTAEDRDESTRALERLRRSAEFYRVNQRQYAYYDEWYYPVIRELAVHGRWEGDFARLGAMVRPSLTPEKARKAVDTLVEIGLLTRGSDGTFAQAAQAVTAQEVPAVITRKSRKEYLQLAVSAMEQLDTSERHISGVTVAMSRKRYESFFAKIDEVRRQILESALDDAGADGVYQFNFQAFPLSAPLSRGEAHDVGGTR